MGTDEALPASFIEAPQSIIPQAGEAARPPAPVSSAFTSQEIKSISKAIRSPKSPPTQDGWNNLLQNSWRSLTGSTPSDSKAASILDKKGSSALPATIVESSRMPKKPHTGSIQKESPLSLVPSSVSNKGSSEQNQHANQLYSILNGGASIGETKEVAELVHHLPNFWTEEQRDALDGFLMKLVKKPMYADLTTRGVLEEPTGVFSVTLRGKGCKDFEAELKIWIEKWKPDVIASEPVQMASVEAGVAIDPRTAHDAPDSPIDQFEDSIEDLDIDAGVQKGAMSEETIAGAQHRPDEPRQRVHTRETLLQLSPQYRKESLDFGSDRSFEAEEDRGLSEEAPSSSPNVAEAGTVNAPDQPNGSAQDIAAKPSGWLEPQEEMSKTMSLMAREPLSAVSQESEAEKRSAIPHASADNEAAPETQLPHPVQALEASPSGHDARPRLGSAQLIRMSTPKNSLRWCPPDGSAAARLRGSRFCNLNMIAAVSGVYAICQAERHSGDPHIYVIGSPNKEPTAAEVRSIRLAIKIITAFCQLLGVPAAAPKAQDISSFWPTDAGDVLSPQEHLVIHQIAQKVRPLGGPPKPLPEDLAFLANEIKQINMDTSKVSDLSATFAQPSPLNSAHSLSAIATSRKALCLKRHYLCTLQTIRNMLSKRRKYTRGKLWDSTRALQICRQAGPHLTRKGCHTLSK
jgi:hypothetical protein